MDKLKEVDPVMADRWHQNDRRKIQRSLEIYLKTGKPASQIYEEQRLNREKTPDSVRSETVTVGSGPSLRFPTLVLWVHAPKDVLNPRLDARIIKMLDQGLLSEVETLANFRSSYEAETGKVVDQSRGIWVSIGYKEFLDYQVALSSRPKAIAELERLRFAAVERTQAATRQYAKRQIRWISIKLLNALIEAGQRDNVFLLDGSDLSKWEENVLNKSRDITEAFLSGGSLPMPTELSALAKEMLVPKRNYDLAQRPDLWQKKTCEACGTVAVNENDWNLHIKSRGHRRNVGTKKKETQDRQIRPGTKKAVQADLVDILESYQQTLAKDDSNEEI
jgi:tRNA dimethylallyltransferase